MALHVRAYVDPSALRAATEKATAKALKRSAAYTRKVAMNSIRRGKKASVKGTPPHTRRGRLKKAILFHSDGISAIIGPSTELISNIGAAHEHGLRMVLKRKRRKYHVGTSGPIDVRKGSVIWAHLYTEPQVDRARRIDAEVWVETSTKTADYPERPFMRPALDKVAPKLNEFWKDSIR